MKTTRISQALGSISDEFSREAIEEFEKTSNQNDSIIPEGKPRVLSEEKSRKAPIFIALAGLCAAAAVAVPLVLKNVGRNSLVASDNSSGVVESSSQISSDDLSDKYKNLPFVEGRGVYGETEIPDFHVKGDEEGCIRSLENFSRGLESMVLETKTVGDYKVKLVGENVRTDLAYYPDKIFAADYCVEIEKDGKTLGSERLPSSFLGLAQATHEFRFFKDKIGSYLDVYEMKQPVVAMKYYYDDASSVTDLSKIVTFAMITPKEQIMMLEGNFGRGIAASYNMSSSSNKKEIITNDELFAENPDLDGTGQWLGFHSIFAADKFRIADYKTLVDDEAGIKFTFNFNVDLHYDRFAYTAEWTDDAFELTGKNIAAKVEKLKVSMNGNELSAVPDDVNPNVNFVTFKFDSNKNDKFGIVVNPDGTFELFEGDVVSKESIIDNIPDDSFGYMVIFNNPGWEARCSGYNIDKPIDRNCSTFVEDNGIYTIQFWTSNTHDIYDIQIKMNKLGYEGSLEIYDNGNGTYSAVMVTQ